MPWSRWSRELGCSSRRKSAGRRRCRTCGTGDVAVLAALLLAATVPAQEGGWGGVRDSNVAARAASRPEAWGNVLGRVVDAWGRPVEGVSVSLESFQATRATLTDSVGRFVFPGVPLSPGDDSATVVAGDGSTWPATRLFVQPGALLAPRVLFQPGSAILEPAGTSASLPNTAQAAARSAAVVVPMAGPWSVFATREGLVGLTTANGHMITQSDHFVALPSKRALNANDSSREFMVELVNGSRSVRVPVLDVGPWNTRDDWWHDTLRETFSDLPRGTPEALAAFRDGYNGGLDGSDRKVLNGAGIDLGDGVFWNDLGMVNNGNIEVRLLWKLSAAKGDRVRLRQWANVRDSAGGKLLFKALCGEFGTIAGPPRGGFSGSKWYLYWPVAWDRGSLGWVVENYLTRDSASVACSDAVSRTGTRSFRLRADCRGVTVRADRAMPAVVERVAASGRILSRTTARLDAGENRIELPRPTALEFVRLRADGAWLAAARTP